MNRTTEPDALIHESRVLQDQGNLMAALEHAERAVNGYSPSESPQQWAAALVRVAEIRSCRGQYAQALEDTHRAIPFLIDQPQWVDALIVQGTCLTKTDQMTAAEEKYQQAADLSRQMGYPAGLAEALFRLAFNVHMIRGHFDLALATMSQSSKICAALNLPNWGFPFLKASIFSRLGNLTDARAAMDALLPSITLGSNISGLYHLLWGRISLGEYEVARAGEYLRMAIILAERIDAPILNILTRIEICRYHRLNNHPAWGISWVGEALLLAQNRENAYFRGIALVERARALQQNGDLMSARTDLIDSIQAFERVQAGYEQSVAALLLAGIDQNTQQPAARARWLDAARRVQQTGYGLLLDQERAVAYPLIAEHLHSCDAEEHQASLNMVQLLGQVTPPPLNVTTLGEFNVKQGGRDIPREGWLRRRSGELFRYLLLQPQFTASRDRIMDALWGPTLSHSAVEQFHQATSMLRRLLEPELPDKFPSRYLRVDADQVQLVLPGSSVIDFQKFEDEFNREQNLRTLEGLRALDGLYGGDLYPQDVDAHWALEMRQHLSLIHSRLLILLAEEELKAGQLIRAMDCCRKVLLYDPYSEEAAELAMRGFIQLESPTQAMQVYLMIEKRLEEDLQMRPSTALRALVRKIRQR
ncbi:MAG: BTAD domain-containing putative transcriptional regulator [Anaerolineaceae bacterium]